MRGRIPPDRLTAASGMLLSTIDLFFLWQKGKESLHLELNAISVFEAHEQRSVCNSPHL